MPRGSQPGERRGGRKRGTPNKKTVLNNAVFLAAAQDPGRSPLDFMLALMRDPQVPLDERIYLAAKAAPFVHARPAPMPKSDDLKFGDLETKPAANGGGDQNGAGGEGRGDDDGLSPLDFLLGVMADPAADSEQRVTAAAMAARYKHAVAAPDPEAPRIVVADKFGFEVAPELARAERDDRLREAMLRSSQWRRQNSLSEKAAEQELEQIGKRRAERLAQVKFPDTYTDADRQNDEGRLARLASKRSSGRKLTPQEDAEEAHLSVRALNPRAQDFRAQGFRLMDVFYLQARSGELKGPKGRIYELQKRRVIAKLTPAEEHELEELSRQNPETAAVVAKMNLEYDYWVDQEMLKLTEAGVEEIEALQRARMACSRFKKTGCTTLWDLKWVRERCASRWAPSIQPSKQPDPAK